MTSISQGHKICLDKWGAVQSHRERIGDDSRFLVDKVPIELPVNWSSYVDEPLSEKELEKIRVSINRQSPYGDIDWQIKISKELGLESTFKSLGRPRKKIKNE